MKYEVMGKGEEEVRYEVAVRSIMREFLSKSIL